MGKRYRCFPAGDGASREANFALPAPFALLVGLAAVLASSWLFTNALEWFGLRSGIAHGALGSVFAAIGTALPETLIALLAVLTGGRNNAPGVDVSLGAILGAPLLLSTLGFGVLGLGALRRRDALHPSQVAVRRDLTFFLVTYGILTVLGFVGGGTVAERWVVAVGLTVCYVVFVRMALATAVASEGDPPRRLFAARVLGLVGAPWVGIAAQLLVGLGAMFIGAELFVTTLTGLSVSLKVSGFIMAAVIAPLATELPETTNSLVWLAQSKDDLAVGNVTGALVLQGALIPAIGLLLTPWRFAPAEGVAALVALGGAAAVLVTMWRSGRLPMWVLMAVPGLYAAFLIWVL